MNKCEGKKKFWRRVPGNFFAADPTIPAYTVHICGGARGHRPPMRRLGHHAFFGPPTLTPVYHNGTSFILH